MMHRLLPGRSVNSDCEELMLSEDTVPVLAVKVTPGKTFAPPT
jgi:hypothetical protein